MKKRFSFHIGSLITFTGVFYLAYYLLLEDNPLHLSIASIINYSHPLAIKKHLLVVGFLPIYISMIIFGAALLGIYLGSALQNLFARYFLETAKNKSSSKQKTTVGY